MIEEYDVAQEATRATERLQEARRNLTSLKEEEEEYLKGREEKAKSRLQKILIQSETALRSLDETVTRIEKSEKVTSQKLNEFAAGLASLLECAKDVVSSSLSIEARAQKTLDVYNRLNEDLTHKTKELSMLEKRLKQREILNIEREKTVDDKLEEAKRLAHWHKTEARYNE